MAETTSPGEDGSDWVRGSGTSLLPLTIVSGDCAVCGFSFHDVVSVHADGSHQAERTEALGHNIRLYVTIIVFTSPNEATIALDCLRDQVIDQSVLIVETFGLHLSEVFFAVDSLESVDKETVVLFKNSVFTGHLQREVSV